MKNRTAAILIAFFGGCFGLHKFYLGENVAGLLYLLFSWTLIPTILSFFDFLGLVMTSEVVFDSKYNAKMLTGTYIPRTAKDITGAIGDLKKLYDLGALTAEEYEEKRQKLLKDL